MSVNAEKAVLTAPEKINGDVQSNENKSERWLALAVVLCAPFLSVLDFFIVNIAVPSIRENLNASFGAVQLVIASYGLSYAVFLVTGGRLGDIYGRKRTFLVGISGFTVASALCGGASTVAILIAARTFQGLFAALMVPQALAIIQTNFVGSERGKALGIFGATIGFAGICGQLLGGILVGSNLFGLGWRSIFLVNVPVGIAAFLAARKFIPESRESTTKKLDLIGVLILSLALFLLVGSLVERGGDVSLGWTLAAIAVSGLLFVAFAFYERYKEKLDNSPLVPLQLFGDRAFVVGLFVSLVFFGGLAAFFLMLTVFLQAGLQFTPMATSIVFAPFAIGFLTASLVSNKLVPFLKRRILQIGAATMIIGIVALEWLLKSEGSAVQSWQFIPILLLYGSGQGLVVAPLLDIVLSGVRRVEAGAAAGVLTTMQQIAASLGVGLVGGVFFAHLNASPLATDEFATGAVYVAAFAQTLYYNVALLAATILLIFLLPEQCGTATAVAAEEDGANLRASKAHL